MGELNVGISSTIIGTLVVTIILSFNAFVWSKRGRIKSSIVGWYDRKFREQKESKYTIGASEYIKIFKHWVDSSQEGITIILPYFHIEMPYDNVISIKVFRNGTQSGNIIEVIFRECRKPKYQHFFGVTNEEIDKIARRIYFQEVVGNETRIVR